MAGFNLCVECGCLSACFSAPVFRARAVFRRWLVLSEVFRKQSTCSSGRLIVIVVIETLVVALTKQHQVVNN